MLLSATPPHPLAPVGYGAQSMLLSTDASAYGSYYISSTNYGDQWHLLHKL